MLETIHKAPADCRTGFDTNMPRLRANDGTFSETAHFPLFSAPAGTGLPDYANLSGRVATANGLSESD